MTLLARIWSRIFGVRFVSAEFRDEDTMNWNEEDVVWAWHCRGVLHVVTCTYGGERDPRWYSWHYRLPLSGIRYWTKTQE